MLSSIDTQISNAGHTGNVGTPMYLPPEILAGEPYSSKVDIYSLGLVMLELISGIGTDHERYQVFHRYKTEGRVEGEVQARYPEETALFRYICQSDQRTRPDIESVLGSE